MGATIKDIAKNLGISVSTVARALSDHPHTRQETKSRVAKAAKDLNYVPSSAARAMRSAHNGSVGLLLPNLVGQFFHTVAEALADQCSHNNFSLMLSVTNDDPELEYRHIRTMIGAQVAGVVIIPSPTITSGAIELLTRRPVIQLYRTDARISSDCVTLDDAHATYEAAKHLIGLGHKAIAYIGLPAAMSVGAERLKGYRSALSEGHIDVDENLIRLVGNEGDGGAEFSRLYKKLRPTAVIAGSPRLSLALAQDLDSLNIPVPQGVSIVGVGNEDWTRYWRSGLTTVEAPIRKLALAATDMLFRRIKATNQAQVNDFTTAFYRSRLIVRDSTGRPRAIGSPP